MNRRGIFKWIAGGCLWISCAMLPALSLAQGTEQAPDAFIKQMSTDVLETIRADSDLRAGDVNKIKALVDGKIMPNVNFSRMTAAAVGPAWRKASDEQKNRLQTEFKTLLVRTYAGALTQVSDQSIRIKPMRGSPSSDTDVLVRTEVVGKGEPVQLDYRLEKTSGQGMGWKIYNLNVMGVWVVDTYRNQFAQEINARGVDGLITSLAELNQAKAHTLKN